MKNIIAIIISVSVFLVYPITYAQVEIKPDSTSKTDVESVREWKLRLAPTPPMGWNSWNQFGENINEQLIMETIDAMVESGMKEAGYEYVILDDGWQRYKGSREEYPLEADPEKFPNGIKYLADYAKSKGLKLGIYSGPGNTTCAGYTGSFGHEEEDAKLWASWGIEYLKYDGCCHPGEGTDNIETYYEKMSNTLRKYAPNIVYHLCHCGFDNAYKWAGKYAHLWRMGPDIVDDFDYPGYYWDYHFDILDYLDHADMVREYTEPGGWNNFDMLVVGLNGQSKNDLDGPGMSPVEYRTHFAMWCMFSSPLIAGNDIVNMDEDTKKILTNKELIAINQDSLGIQAKKVKDIGNNEIYAKPLSDGSWAVALVNRGKKDSEIKFEFERDIEIPFNKVKIRDVEQHKDLGEYTKKYSTVVKSHQTIVLRISNAE